MTAEHKPEVLAITESWLSSDVSSTELFSSEFTVHRRDCEENRPGVMSGGVLLAVNNSVKSTRKRDMEPSGCEVLVCDAKPPGKNASQLLYLQTSSYKCSGLFYYFRRNHGKGIIQLFIVPSNWRL